MNLEDGYCVDSLGCYDPLELAMMRDSKTLFRRYKEIKELEKVKDLSIKEDRNISITSKDVETDLSKNEVIEYVLNNLDKFESRIKFWIMVDDIIQFYPRLINNVKNFLRKL